MNPPVSDQKAEHLDNDGAMSGCEQSPSTTLNAGGLFWASEKESVVVLDAGATANLVCFGNKGREQHNLVCFGNIVSIGLSNVIDFAKRRAPEGLDLSLAGASPLWGWAPRSGA